MLHVLEIEEDLNVPTTDDWQTANEFSDEDYDLILEKDRELREGRPPIDDWSWQVFD